MQNRLVAAACTLALLASACKKTEPPPPAQAGHSAAPDANAAATSAGAPQGLAQELSGGSVVLAQLPDEQRATAAGAGSELPSRQFVFGERGGVAWVEPDGARFRIIHNGRAGGSYSTVEAPVLSADGARCAYAAQLDGRWRIVVDGKEDVLFDAVEEPVFSPDGAHLAYRAKQGGVWRLVVDGKPNAGTRPFRMHAFSGDSARIVAIDDVDEQGVGRLVVSDLAFKQPTVVARRVVRALLDADGSTVAAITVGDDGMRVVSAALARPERLTRGRAQDQIAHLAFAPDGKSVAYVAEKGGKRSIVLGDREEPVSRTDVIVTTPVVRPDGAGLGVAVVSGETVSLREYFVKDSRPEGAYNGVNDLVYSNDGRSRAYAAEKGGNGFIVANGHEGPVFDRVVTPRFSPDGKFLVYRARKDGKRFVVVADADGKTIRQHPAYEQVFPIRFADGGKSIAYGVKDGRRLVWKIEPLRSL